MKLTKEEKDIAAAKELVCRNLPTDAKVELARGVDYDGTTIWSARIVFPSKPKPTPTRVDPADLFRYEPTEFKSYGSRNRTREEAVIDALRTYQRHQFRVTETIVC